MKKRKKECFVNGHCCYECPNFGVQEVYDKYGYRGVVDMGLKEIKCSECLYESGECEDCLFANTVNCPVYKVVI